MRVLLLGAYGFIGSAIARALLSDGHVVIGLGRDPYLGRRILPELRWIGGDLTALKSPEDWLPIVGEVDVVINCTGLLQGSGRETVEAVQFDAVAALVEACERRRLNYFVHISAAGAASDAPTDFMRTKARADSMALESDVAMLVLRPGLVIGRNSFGGTELIRMAAALPVAFSYQFDSRIQCFALTDLTHVVRHALQTRVTGSYDLVEAGTRTLGEIIEQHRRWLGFGEPRIRLPLPKLLLRLSSRAADAFGSLGWRSPLRSNAVLSLEAGVTGDPAQARALLDRDPLTLEQTLNASPAGKQDRLQSRLALIQPILLASLGLMWAASGAAALLDPAKAAAILTASGVSETIALAIAAAGGAVDLMLAAALLWRRTVRAALVGMILVTLLYLAGATLLVPHLWEDPLQPLTKAISAGLLALVCRWLAEER